MSIFRTKFGALLLLVLIASAVGLGAVVYRVDRATTPERVPQEMFDFASMQMRVDEVTFSSVDGVELHGWWMPSLGDAPAILLCHDIDSSKRSLVNLAIELHAQGFSVLTFDFRGHGDSAGSRSSLGLAEKRDILGALDWLKLKNNGGPVGIFGAGMGAHASVLAAAERRELDVLVLDGLYPDVGFTLTRRVGEMRGWTGDLIAGTAGTAYLLLHGDAPNKETAASLLGTLGGRDLLLLAPAHDTRLVERMQEMAGWLPVEADSEGNLVVVPATLGEGLYGEQLARYHRRVAAFFSERLQSSQIARIR